MNPTREQLFGYVRTIVAGVAGYTSAKSPALKEFLSPTLVEAFASLLFFACLYWSHTSKKHDNENVSNSVQPPAVKSERPDSMP